MSQEIIVPRLGWSMEEGAFVGWLKPDGAVVRAGEPLFTIEGDKAAQEIESIDTGILRIAPNGPRPGDPVRVGDVLGLLVSIGAAAQAETPRPPAPQTPEPEKPNPPAVTVANAPATIPPTIAPASPAPAEPPPPPPPQRRAPAISPRALRIAAELGVDWTALTGSGRTGRIRERDVRAAGPKPRAVGSDTRRVIAQRMRTSLAKTAPVTLHTTTDATHLVELRRHLKATLPPSSAIPSYLDMVVKATATALQRHPALNARWEDDTLVLLPVQHIGIAVDTEMGLLVPVLRDVDARAITELAVGSQALIERARARQLTAEELRGGTFTVTSLGAFGIEAFTPIINYPEVAILGVGRIQRQPVVVGDQIVARERVSLSLTFDHCALDGAPAARFLQTLVALLEHPLELTQTA